MIKQSFFNDRGKNYYKIVVEIEIVVYSLKIFS